jgi:hypothetical protein
MKKVNRDKKPNQLDAYEKFIKLNSVILTCPKRSKGKSNEDDLANTKSSRKEFVSALDYKLPLKKLTQSYIDLAEEISEGIINRRFDKIYEDIYHFGLTMEYYTDAFYQALILNTDQNADTFFENMEKYFQGKFEIVFKYDHHFSDMKGLVKDLKLFKDVDYDNMDEVKVRLVVVRDIQKIDTTVLNIFLNKVIEIHQDIMGPYKNIIIFDVGYDPRSLFDKIKPNLLTKMIFNNIENIASKDIYKEILYQYVYESNSLFMPNTVNLKKIVDYVNNHQISIYSFKHYFKFLIIDFFLIHEWHDEEFLIFSNLKNHFSTVKIEWDAIFKKYKDLKDLTPKQLRLGPDELQKIHRRRRETRDYFFKIYRILEELAKKSSGKQESAFNKFQFFFEFLQFGAENEKLISKRRDLLKSYIFADKIDCIDLVNTDLIPPLGKIIEEAEKSNSFIKGLNGVISSLQEKLTSIENKNSKILNDNVSSRIKGICFAGGKKDNLPSSLRNQDVQHIVSDWLLSFLKLDCFSDIFSYDKLNRSRYINFSEVTNPSLPGLVVNDLTAVKRRLTTSDKMDIEDEEVTTACEAITKENLKHKINKVDLLEQFLVVFGNMGSEFKLKYFFVDYLSQFMELEEIDKNKYVDQIKCYFLKMCHEFYILGLIARKRAKGDLFIKNYYQIANYYKN